MQKALCEPWDTGQGKVPQFYARNEKGIPVG